MKQGQCKHFNGVLEHIRGGKSVCKGGVDIRQVTGGSDAGWIKRMPCIAHAEMFCSEYAEPTPEEIKIHEEERGRWMDDFMKKLALVDPLIVSLKESHPNGGEGIEECPSCKGSLHWGIAACNGHIHMRCETQDCINFME